MPLRMRVDGFADGGTHISNHNRADRAIMYIIRGKNKGKTPLRMRVDGFADGGTHISHHTRSCMSLSLFRESHCLFV